MASSSSQRRCVFVGNIPYDATEEQLRDICGEVGPVVSFRLVTDRETGKPKGYGFCEYKDEETALSARRNLQSYEINGRQLRVDFAENDKDKGTDKTPTPGQGGPGLPPATDSQKQMGGPGDSNMNQPVGLHLAIQAASVMAGALGGPQVGSQFTQSTVATSDPLTLHLAKMSRSQLADIISSIKLMATQNNEQARQLLVSRPQLLKSVFLAQIMLGIVSPQVLQSPNIVQAPSHMPGSSVQGTGQVSSQNLLPPVAQRSQPLTRPPHSQYPVQQSSKQAFSQIPQQLAQAGPSSTNPPRSQIKGLPETAPFQRQKQVVPVSTSLGYSSQTSAPNNVIQPSQVPRPVVTNSAMQQGGQTVSLNYGKRIKEEPHQLVNRPSKMMRVDDRRTSLSGGHASNSMLPNQVQLQEKAPQTHLSPDVQSTLLQQVMNLTPEQLRMLTPEQQQEVIKLQQALKQEHLMQPS